MASENIGLAATPAMVCVDDLGIIDRFQQVLCIATIMLSDNALWCYA